MESKAIKFEEMPRGKMNEALAVYLLVIKLSIGHAIVLVWLQVKLALQTIESKDTGELSQVIEIWAMQRGASGVNGVLVEGSERSTLSFK